MKREIKFRGKWIDKEEWIYGDILQYADSGECEIVDMYNSQAWVDPETVGQYTGLKDKNGIALYEGDIVSVRSLGGIQMNMLIAWGDRGFIMVDKYDIQMSDGLMDGIWCYAFEIIGNIYDNPEFMKGGENDKDY